MEMTPPAAMPGMPPMGSPLSPGLGQALFPEPAPMAEPSQVPTSSTAFLSAAGGLPPKRNPGQPPMSTVPPSGAMPAPAWNAAPMAPSPVSLPPTPGFGPTSPLAGQMAAPAAENLPTAPQGTSSRLIPGAPSLPTLPVGGTAAARMPSMTGPLAGGSLLGRETAPAPVTPATQLLTPTAPTQSSPILSLNPSPIPGMEPISIGAPVAPMPSGRQLSALRPSRGTNFIRLGLAAVFLLGFLGLAGYFIKDAFFPKEVVVEEPPAPPTPTPVVPEPVKTTPAMPQGEPVRIAQTPQSTPVTAPLPVTPQPVIPGTTPAPVVPDLTGETVMKPALPATPEAAASEIVQRPPVPAVPELGTSQSAVPPVASTPAPAPATVPMKISQSSTGEDMPPTAQPALDALKAFLAAPSLPERMKHTLGTEYLRPHMELYYRQNQDGPLAVDHIAYGRFDSNPELGAGAHCIFHLESKSWEYPVPIMLEERGDGWKVDWLAFVELKDRKLEAFFQNYSEGRALFHVGVFRQHYFEDDVPNRDQKDAFSLGLPRPNPFRKAVFLSKDSPLSAQLRDRLPWETHVWAIVELEWKKLGTQQWVELVSVPQMHWYSLPTPTSTRPVTAPDNAAAGAPETYPPGIRKNGTGANGNTPPPGIKKSPATRGR